MQSPKTAQSTVPKDQDMSGVRMLQGILNKQKGLPWWASGASTVPWRSMLGTKTPSSNRRRRLGVNQHSVSKSCFLRENHLFWSHSTGSDTRLPGAGHTEECSFANKSVFSLLFQCVWLSFLFRIPRT